MSDNVHHLTAATQINRGRMVLVCFCGYTSNTLEIQGEAIFVCCTNCGREAPAAEFDVRLSAGLLAEKVASMRPLAGGDAPKQDHTDNGDTAPARITVLQSALKSAIRVVEAEGVEAVALVATVMSTGFVRVATAPVDTPERADWMRKRCSDIVGLIEDICAEVPAPEMSDDQSR
jgi:hypothetical protein